MEALLGRILPGVCLYVFTLICLCVRVCVWAKDNPVGDHMVFICLKTGETVCFHLYLALTQTRDCQYKFEETW